MINKIKSKTVILLINLADINLCFREFYYELYYFKDNVTESNFNKKCYSLLLPKLSDAARHDLDSDFTLQEVVAAIKSFPSGKAGPMTLALNFIRGFALLLRMI